MIRRPPRSTLDRSSAASDVYKRQTSRSCSAWPGRRGAGAAYRRRSVPWSSRPPSSGCSGSGSRWSGSSRRRSTSRPSGSGRDHRPSKTGFCLARNASTATRWSLAAPVAVSYTHLRAHETVLDLVCRLLLEKKNTKHTFCDVCLIMSTKQQQLPY